MNKYSRRDILKLGLAGLGAAVLRPQGFAKAYLPDFPIAPRLGRTFYTVDIKSKPDPESTTVKSVYNDSVLILNREVIGKTPTMYWRNRRWFETPEGFIPAISVQPVENNPAQPVSELPVYGEKPGMWTEVKVPFVDLYLDGDTPKSPTLLETTNPRFYYSQILWIDGIKQGANGETLYHVTEKHGSYGDTFWADARAFTPITPEDLTPITPEITNKYITVNLTHQTLSCFENDQEILFTRVSTGAKYNYEGKPVDEWSTPVGDFHSVSRKYISLHMAGGTSASGFEQFAVGFTSIFATGGVAIHSTYWHNNYGEMLSHGCVNVEPEISKFIYRWTMPEAPYYDGKIEVQGFSNGTNVRVSEFRV